MTIAEHIDAIKALLKQETKDSLISDRLIYTIMRSVRSKLLRQKLSKNKYFNRQNVQKFCLKLEKDNYHDCDCVPIGCTVLKSTQELPVFLANNSRLIMDVQTFDGTPISLLPAHFNRVKKNSRWLKNQMTYDIQNNKIILFGNLNLQAVLILGVLEDPSEAVDYTLCEANGNESVCFDPKTSDFPIDPDLVMDMRRMVIQEITGVTLQLKQDEINDNND